MYSFPLQHCNNIHPRFIIIDIFTLTFKVFEGVPAPYDKMKKMVVPDALKVLRLQPKRKVTVLGRLASEVGWKYNDVVSELETKRKAKALV